MKITKAFLIAFSLIVSYSPLIAQTETKTLETQGKSKDVEQQRVPDFPEDPEKILREDDLLEGEEPNFYKEFFNMLFTLALLIAALLGISWFVRRMNLSRIQYVNVSSAIKIIDHRPLSPRSTLYVVHYAGKEYLLGESQTGINILGTETKENSSKDTVQEKKFME